MKEGYDLAVEAQGVTKTISSVVSLMQSALPEEFVVQINHLRLEANKNKREKEKSMNQSFLSIFLKKKGGGDMILACYLLFMKKDLD